MGTHSAVVAPADHITNEWYARDISRKIRSSQRLRGSAGVPLSLTTVHNVQLPKTIENTVLTYTTRRLSRHRAAFLFGRYLVRFEST